MGWALCGTLNIWPELWDSAHMWVVKKNIVFLKNRKWWNLTGKRRSSTFHNISFFEIGWTNIFPENAKNQRESMEIHFRFSKKMKTNSHFHRLPLFFFQIFRFRKFPNRYSISKKSGCFFPMRFSLYCSEQLGLTDTIVSNEGCAGKYERSPLLFLKMYYANFRLFPIVTEFSNRSLKP